MSYKEITIPPAEPNKPRQQPSVQGVVIEVLYPVDDKVTLRVWRESGPRVRIRRRRQGRRYGKGLDRPGE